MIMQDNSRKKVTNSLEWYCPDFDLTDFATSGVKESLADYVEENKRIIYQQWEGEDYENLEKTLGYGSMILRHFVNRLAEDRTQNVLFEIGTLKGAIESFEYLLYEKAAELRLMEANSQHFSSVKHLKEVIQVLETHGSVTQSELCSYLGLRASTLSEAMKKILNTNLVLSAPVGKFKLYTLSDTGIKYGRLLRKKKNNGDIDNIFRLLNESISGIKDIREIGQIKNELYKTLGIADKVLELHQQSSSRILKHIYDERAIETQIDASLNNNHRNNIDLSRKKDYLSDFTVTNDYISKTFCYDTLSDIKSNNEINAVAETVVINRRLAG